MTHCCSVKPRESCHCFPSGRDRHVTHSTVMFPSPLLSESPCRQPGGVKLEEGCVFQGLGFQLVSGLVGDEGYVLGPGVLCTEASGLQGDGG